MRFRLFVDFRDIELTGLRVVLGALRSERIGREFGVSCLEVDWRLARLVLSLWLVLCSED